MSKEISVRKLDPPKFEQWNALVDKTPYGTVFNKSFWLQIHAEALEADFAIYGCYQGGNLIAGCALYFRTSAAFKVVTVPPGTPYMGPLIQPPSTSDYVQNIRHDLKITALLASALEDDFDRLLIINQPGFMDIRPFLWKNWSAQVLYTYIVSLDNIEKPSKKLGKTIRKASRLGIEAKSSCDIYPFYDIWRKTFSRKDSAPRFSREVLEKIFSKLQEHHCCRLHIAVESEGRLISGRIVVFDGRKASGWLSGTDPAYLNTGVSSLLQWHTLQDLKSECDTFNMVGANLESIARFKSEFGGELVPYYLVETYRSSLIKCMFGAREIMKKSTILLQETIGMRG